jgi:nucleotide-binding universal stress UspA family protein
MYERILVPLDGSEEAEQVLPHVVPIAKAFGSVVVVLQAVAPKGEIFGEKPEGPPVIGVAPEAPAVQTDVTVERAEAYLAGVVERLHHEGIEVNSSVAEGPAAGIILDYVKSFGVSLVAMTTHGRGGVGRVMMGSVAADVVQRSAVPVLLIRRQS